MDDNNNPNDDLNDIILPDDLSDDTTSDSDLPDDIQDQIAEEEEERDTRNSQTPPARADEEWQEGVTMDDDVDVLGEEILGKGYKDTEPIDITKKYSPTSKIEPPDKETVD